MAFIGRSLIHNRNIHRYSRRLVVSLEGLVSAVHIIVRVLCRVPRFDPLGKRLCFGLAMPRNPGKS